MLNTKGSPWAVRWFFVKPASLYVSARASDDTLNLKKAFYSGDNLNSLTISSASDAGKPVVEQLQITTEIKSETVVTATTPSEATEAISQLPTPTPSTTVITTKSSQQQQQQQQQQQSELVVPSNSSHDLIVVSIAAVLIGFFAGRHAGSSSSSK